MDYSLLQRVVNMVKLKLWHKSDKRICIRNFMLCCTVCNKVYVRDFDGYLCLRVFSKLRGQILTNRIVPTLTSLIFIYSLNNFELDIVINAFSKYYNVSINKSKKQIVLTDKVSCYHPLP